MRKLPKANLRYLLLPLPTVVVMFPMGNGEVLNFGSLSPQGSDSFIPSSPDSIENSRVLPLQNRAPGNMGPVEHVPYAPYPPQMGLSGPNQVSYLNLSCSGELIVL